MRLITTTFVVFFVAGCGIASSTRLDVRTPESIAFALHDERPAELRGTTKVQHTWGEATRLGDDALTPPGPALLKTWLHEKLGPDLVGKTVVLEEFLVEVLDPAVIVDERRLGAAVASTPGANPVAGALALPLIGGIERAKSSKKVEVRIIGRVTDRKFLANNTRSFRGGVSEADINSVIARALDLAVTEVQRLMRLAAETPPNSALQPTPASGAADRGR